MTFKDVNLDLKTLQEAELKVAEYQEYLDSLNSKFKIKEPKFPEDELHLVKFASSIRSQTHGMASELFDEVNIRLREIEHKIIDLAFEQPSETTLENNYLRLKNLAQDIHNLREFFGSSWIDSTPSVPNIAPPSPPSAQETELMERMRKFIEDKNLKQS